MIYMGLLRNLLPKPVDFARILAALLEDRTFGGLVGPMTNIEGLLSYSSNIEAQKEKRLMYMDLDVHEALRMVENALNVFNIQASGVDWLSNIVQRELSKLEKIERQRLSLEVMGGFVEQKNVLLIVKDKLRLVVIGAAQHCTHYIEHLIETKIKKGELSKKDEEAKYNLEHNLRYFSEIILKHQIKGICKPLSDIEGNLLSSQDLFVKYSAIALRVSKLENKVVNDYGCVAPIEDYLEWNWEKEHFEVKGGADIELLVQEPE